jgi:hypothetical protein
VSVVVDHVGVDPDVERGSDFHPVAVFRSRRQLADRKLLQMIELKETIDVLKYLDVAYFK